MGDVEGIAGAYSKKAQAGHRQAKSTRWGKKRFRQYGSKADFVRVTQRCIAYGNDQGDECDNFGLREGPEACHGTALSHDPNSNTLFAGCTKHHEMSDGRRDLPAVTIIGNNGRGAFERLFGVSIDAECERIETEWKAWCRVNKVDPRSPKDRPKAKKLLGEQANTKAHAEKPEEIYRQLLENVQADLGALEGVRHHHAHAVRTKLHQLESVLRRALS